VECCSAQPLSSINCHEAVGFLALVVERDAVVIWSPIFFTNGATPSSFCSQASCPDGNESRSLNFCHSSLRCGMEARQGPHQVARIQRCKRGGVERLHRSPCTIWQPGVLGRVRLSILLPRQCDRQGDAVSMVKIAAIKSFSHQFQVRGLKLARHLLAKPVLTGKICPVESASMLSTGCIRALPCSGSHLWLVSPASSWVSDVQTRL